MSETLFIELIFSALDKIVEDIYSRSVAQNCLSLMAAFTAG